LCSPSRYSIDVRPVHSATTTPPTILVFTRTTGYRHDSIPVAVTAVTAVRAIGLPAGFAVVATEDPRAFSDASLRRVRAVAFLLTTGTMLDAVQSGASERFIRHDRAGSASALPATPKIPGPSTGGLSGPTSAATPRSRPPQ